MRKNKEHPDYQCIKIQSGEDYFLIYTEKEKITKEDIDRIYKEMEAKVEKDRVQEIETEQKSVIYSSNETIERQHI